MKLIEVGSKLTNLKENKMISNQVTSQTLKLEVVVLPVADVDRSKDFYKTLGWRLDADFVTGEDFRVVQFTPPGSAASIIFGKGISSAAPGSVQGLYLIVYDISAARAELIDRGVEVSEVFHDIGGIFPHAGTEGRVAGPDPERRDYASYASFSDPDGNGWVLQEIRVRKPGR
ncbi:VOC family protein [Scytonema sp. PCC 10023]|uniref:VOC family protein n=1 Tax=Scytonema sp. PCC 10023 TaxID=1680591 RepID=UPI0039C707D7